MDGGFWPTHRHSDCDTDTASGTGRTTGVVVQIHTAASAVSLFTASITLIGTKVVYISLLL